MGPHNIYFAVTQFASCQISVPFIIPAIISEYFYEPRHFFFLSPGKRTRKYTKSNSHFPRQKFHRTQIKVPLIFPKCLCSLTQVSVSTDWEIKMKTPMFLRRLLKNTFVGQSYTLEKLYLTKFSSE